MKIKTKQMDYEQVCEQPGFGHEKPVKPNMFSRKLLKSLSASELKSVNFKCEKSGIEKWNEDEPALILMNHSSFIDLKIAATVLYPRPFNIVCTYDGFVGKNKLMRSIGCIPTHKFALDLCLVKDMVFATKELKSSILMYPEASYSFDGTETPLPDSLGKCIKLLKVPVILIRTQGAFARDPLYNNLQLRQVDVSARMEYFLSPEEIHYLAPEEINRRLKEAFSYDHFKWQEDNKIKIEESFRADCLNRALYKCPHCMTEGKMLGKGITLACQSCKKEYELSEYGFLKAKSGETEYAHIPDWYKWERQCVKQELLNNTYVLDIPVDIYMLVNTKAVYQVGEGRLKHSVNGFELTGCNGKIDYKQAPSTSYSVYSDFYWYEIGDMICIGDEKIQYYCFPKDKMDVVAKTRLATEELYKIVMQKS